MTLGERINELRKERNYSQEYIAHEMDISRQAVYKWEKDLSSPDTAHLIKLAELFGVSVEYLATGKTENIIFEKPAENTIRKSRKKRSRFFKATVSILCILCVILISSVAFIATRPVSWDSGACSGGFEKYAWDMYCDELFEKYKTGAGSYRETLNLIEDSWDVAYKGRKIVFFFDVEVVSEDGVKRIDHVHIKGTRIWTMKYVFEHVYLSKKLNPEEFFG